MQQKPEEGAPFVIFRPPKDAERMLSLMDVVEALPLFETEETSFKYAKGARRKGAGFRYEEQVIALSFLRCLRRQLPDFELTSDNCHAGKFDDVVITWRGDRGKCALLVQLKHKTSQESEEIKKGHLFSSSDNQKSDFNIRKYQESFRLFRKNVGGVQYALVISTNAPLHENTLEYLRHRTTDSVLGGKLLDAGGRAFALNTRAVCAVCPCDKDFMEHFYMFCSQRDVHEIKKDICTELVNLLGPSDNYDALCEELCRGVMEWKDTPSDSRDSLNGSWSKWRDIVLQHRLSKVTVRSGLMTRLSNRDVVAVRQRVREITDCNGLTMRLKFRDVKAVRQHLERANPAYVRPLSAETLAMSVTKVHQVIGPEAHILMNIEQFKQSQQSVLRWWGPYCKWLVLVDEETQERGQSSYLLDTMKGQLRADRHLVVVSLRHKVSFQDSFQCSDISDETWDELLLTKIRINGDKHTCEIRDLVSSTVELQALVKHRPSSLVALDRNADCVMLGQTLQPLPAHYVPQQLVTCRYVKDEFFSSLAERDVCIMDYSTYLRLCDELGYLLKNYKVCTFDKLEEYLASHILVPILTVVAKIDVIALRRICGKYIGLHVYFVNRTECGWDVRHFLGGNGRIRRYVREQTVQLREALDVLNDKVIVEGRPGVGKSTALLDLAREVKQKNPCSWIVHVDLRKWCKKFEESKSGEEISKLLLQSVLSSEGELAELELSLLWYCLQKYEHTVCLVDSFDEVCPDYTEECVQALRLLAPRRGKLVVAARPAAARLLEGRLESLAHLLPAFSDSQLQKYFDQFRPRMSRWRINTLTVPFKNLLRVPLFAEMYRDLSEVRKGPYNVVSLYETFFHHRFGRVYVERFGDDYSDPKKRKQLENLWRYHEAELQQLAGLLLMQDDEIFGRRKQPPVRDVFVKAGIVQLSGEWPMFEHKTFGEYFLAKWCVSDASVKIRAAVYRSAHSGRSLEFFLEVFDRMSSWGRRLLSAVLDGNEGRVRELLQDGVGVEERDDWGRSALHLAAAQGVVPSLVRLLSEHMKEALAEKDGLMNWTPLQYAAKRGHWDTVEALLQAAAGFNQLGSIQDCPGLPIRMRLPV